MGGESLRPRLGDSAPRGGLREPRASWPGGAVGAQAEIQGDGAVARRARAAGPSARNWESRS